MVGLVYQPKTLHYIGVIIESVRHLTFCKNRDIFLVGIIIFFEISAQWFKWMDIMDSLFSVHNIVLIGCGQIL